MRQEVAKRGLIHLPRSRGAAIAIHRGAGALQHKIVEKRIARSSVPGERIGPALCEIGQIGNAAEIENGGRQLDPRGFRERTVKHRNERRAVATGRHVRRAEIEGDRDAEPPRQLVAIANLHGELVFWAMQNSLAVEPDEIDAGAIAVVRDEECLDSLDMALGDHPLRLDQNSGPGVALADLPRVFHSPPKHCAVCIRIGPTRNGPRRTSLSPSVSTSATSTPSIDVPLIKPMLRKSRM